MRITHSLFDYQSPATVSCLLLGTHNHTHWLECVWKPEVVSHFISSPRNTSFFTDLSQSMRSPDTIFTKRSSANRCLIFETLTSNSSSLCSNYSVRSNNLSGGGNMSYGLNDVPSFATYLLLDSKSRYFSAHFSSYSILTNTKKSRTSNR